MIIDYWSRRLKVHVFQDNTLVSPYPGAKEMILIPDFVKVINITNLFECIKNDLKK